MYNPNYEFSAPQGWVCPRCGRVMAPSQSFCPFCSSSQSNIIYASSTKGESDFWHRYFLDNTTASDPTSPVFSTASDGYVSRLDKWLERYSKIGDEDDEV